jgi:hypothetical protein
VVAPSPAAGQVGDTVAATYGPVPLAAVRGYLDALAAIGVASCR